MPYTHPKKMLKLVKNCLIPSLWSRFGSYPMWTHFFLTRRCNLKCKYCFVRDNKLELDTKGVKEVIDKLNTLGIRIIAFFGGEPTLRQDFCEILRYANNKGFFTYITTNGTLLDKEYIERMGECGIDFIELSVDSIFEFNESKKDYTRSKKVLELLVEAQKKYGFGIKTHMVLTKKNIDSVMKTIKIIDKHHVPLTIGLIFRNVYNDLPDDESLYFNDNESKKGLFKVIDDIIELKRQGIRIMDPVDYFRGMKDYVRGKTDWGCRAGSYFMSIDCDGSIMLCCSSKDFTENVLSIDKDHFKNRQEEINKTLSWCQTRCYSNCAFTTSYLMNHPIKALLGR